MALLTVLFALPAVSLPALAAEPIVEISDDVAFEIYVCSECVPSDLDDLTLAPGFSAQPVRLDESDFAEVRKLPSDPDVVVIDIDGHPFQRVARLKGGATGSALVTGGVVSNLESDRTLRFDAGRTLHEIHDGRDTWVRVASPDPDADPSGPLPDGWTRSTRLLTNDLVVFDPTGLPFVFIDDDENVWQRLSADPDDQLPLPARVAGRKLKLVDRVGAPHKRKLRWVAVDDAIAPPAPGSADDPSAVGSWLHLENRTTGEHDSFALRASGWEGLGNPAGSRGWRYRDPKRENGPCKKVLVKPGRIAALCTGASFDLTLDEAGQGALEIGLAFGAVLDWCASFEGEAIRRDESTAAGDRARFDAVKAPAPPVCKLPPMVRRFLEYDAPGDGMVVRGREPDAPIGGFIGAMNMHTVLDPAADAAYSLGVFPLLGQTGAILLTTNQDPDFVDTTNGPAAWAQPVNAMPHYPGAEGILGMVTSEAFGEFAHLKEGQVGDSLHFGFQVCLHDCEFLTTGGIFPPRIAGRVLGVHVETSRFAFEGAVPLLADEAEAMPGLRLGWAGRTIADVFGVGDGQLASTGMNPLAATGSYLYVLDPGVELATVLALPELSAFLADTDQHVIAFFDPGVP